MQDIRQEIKERIRQVREQCEKVQKQLAELEATDKNLQAVLASENALWERLAPPLFRGAEAEGSSSGSGKLGGVLLDLLRNEQVWSVHQFKTELDNRGYPFGDKAAGRVIHFALVGLLKKNAVKKLGHGSWELKQKGGH